MKKLLLTILSMYTLTAIGQPTLVTDIETGFNSSYPSVIRAFEDGVFFFAYTLANGSEYYYSDGNTTTMIMDINPGTGGVIPPGPNNRDYIAFGDEMIFGADDGTNGYELWKYDGTSASMISDIYPGASGSNPTKFIEYNGALYFAANDGSMGSELWKYDGNTISLVMDINPGAGNGAPNTFYIYDGELIFRANNGVNGEELWKFDGTTASLIADIMPGINPSVIGAFAELNGNLYFTARMAIGEGELYKYDGTTVSLAADINPNANAGSNPNYTTAVGNNLLFAANDGTGYKLWKFDGTTASEIINGGGNPEEFAIYNNTLFYSANTADGRELMVFDGTNASIVDDINPGSASSYPTSLTVFDNKLYFAAESGLDYELYVVDGNTISQLYDINPNGGSDAGHLTVSGTNLFFRANDGSTGVELWKYSFCDGSSSSIIESACDSYTSASGMIYTTSGSYSEVMMASNGCDSLVDIQLTITSNPSVSVNQVGNNLEATSGFTSYQWYNVTGIMIGETQPTFSPNADGNYYCIVSDGNCDGTSNTLSFTSTGIHANEIKDLKVYPNPTKGLVYIESNSERIETLHLMEISGKVVKKLDGDRRTINLEGLKSGIYILIVTSEQSKSQVKLTVM